MKKSNHKDLNDGNKEYARIIGTNILRMMKQQKLTLKELAQMADIQYNQLLGYESGKHLPGVVVLYKLAVAFNQPMEMFMTSRDSKCENETSKPMMHDLSDICYSQTDLSVIEMKISKVKALDSKFSNLMRNTKFPYNTPDFHWCVKIKDVTASLLYCLYNMRISISEENSFEENHKEAIDKCKIIEFLLECLWECESISDTDKEEYCEEISVIRKWLEVF